MIELAIKIINKLLSGCCFFMKNENLENRWSSYESLKLNDS